MRKRSFRRRKEPGSWCVVLKFLGSKNKRQPGFPWRLIGSVVGGLRAAVRPQCHKATNQNYSQAADWSLGCRRLTSAPVNQQKKAANCFLQLMCRPRDSVELSETRQLAPNLLHVRVRASISALKTLQIVIFLQNPEENNWLMWIFF